MRNYNVSDAYAAKQYLPCTARIKDCLINDAEVAAKPSYTNTSILAKNTFFQYSNLLLQIN